MVLIEVAGWERGGTLQYLGKRNISELAEEVRVKNEYVVSNGGSIVRKSMTKQACQRTMTEYGEYSNCEMSFKK